MIHLKLISPMDNWKNRTEKGYKNNLENLAMHSIQKGIKEGSSCGKYEVDEEVKEVKSLPNNYLVKRVPGSGSILSKAQRQECVESQHGWSRFSKLYISETKWSRN